MKSKLIKQKSYLRKNSNIHEINSISIKITAQCHTYVDLYCLSYQASFVCRTEMLHKEELFNMAVSDL